MYAGQYDTSHTREAEGAVANGAGNARGGEPVSAGSGTGADGCISEGGEGSWGGLGTGAGDAVDTGLVGGGDRGLLAGGNSSWGGLCTGAGDAVDTGPVGGVERGLLAVGRLSGNGKVGKGEANWELLGLPSGTKASEMEIVCTVKAPSLAKRLGKA